MDGRVIALSERILCHGGGDGPGADGGHGAVDRVVADHGDASRQIHVGQGLDGPYDAHRLSAVDARQVGMRLDERHDQPRSASPIEPALDGSRHLESRGSFA